MGVGKYRSGVEDFGSSLMRLVGDELSSSQALASGCISVGRNLTDA